MSLHLDLLAQARRLARLDPKRPRQANLRRAVSSAYYALFHYLIDQACRNSMGTEQLLVPYRNVFARGFHHGSMKEACRSFSGGQLPDPIRRALPQSFSVPHDLRNVAQTFVELQEHRHTADYDLSANFTRADVLALVQQADAARLQFDQLGDRVVKKFFLTCLMMTWKSLAQRG